jgi:RNA polymerase II subunit A C-terminal domain phosphatase
MYVGCQKILRDVALISNLDDFFLGIGDINSAHLPKPQDPTVPPSSVAMELVAPRSHPPFSLSSSSTPAPLSGVTPLSPRLGSDVNQPSPDLEAAEEASAATNNLVNRVLSRAQSKAIEAVVEERPLAKMQERLDHEDDIEGEEGTRPSRKQNDIGAEDGSSTLEENRAENDSGRAARRTPKPKTKHKILLHNVDQELGRITAVRFTYSLPSLQFTLTLIARSFRF